MNALKKLFSSSPKDERLTAQLGPVYKVGFYIMMFGILFDLYTRYNYLARTDAQGNALAQSPVEWIVLILACVVVSAMSVRRGVYSDSLRYTEARAFSQTGTIAPSVAIGIMIAVAAVGGRMYNEVALFGWDRVTWAGDLAMLIIMLGMFIPLILALQYVCWKSYRTREDHIAAEGELGE